MKFKHKWAADGKSDYVYINDDNGHRLGFTFLPDEDEATTFDIEDLEDTPLYFLSAKSIFVSIENKMWDIPLLAVLAADWLRDANKEDAR